ncbi:hypothetical protein [Calidithermus timidus]|uniref:hypothetical protein n=1 Tax=Calidithermus timidus TaxID=307124 RepID=UPI00037A6020|nr:hypothetical protein [Calidithermus timidus]
MKLASVPWAMLTLLLAVLSACVPQTDQNTQSNLGLSSNQAYLPFQTGVQWAYLPQDAAPNDPPYRLTVLGPAPFGDQIAVKYRFAGRGVQKDYYRQIGPAGVRLLGYEDAVSTAVTRFNPPMLEYPPESQIATGSRWGGVTTVETTLYPPNARPQVIYKETIEYNYRILGKEKVRVRGGEFEVFRVQFEAKGGTGAVDSREIWFVPGVGEVRTKEGFVLVARNFG